MRFRKPDSFAEDRARRGITGISESPQRMTRDDIREKFERLMMK